MRPVNRRDAMNAEKRLSPFPLCVHRVSAVHRSGRTLGAACVLRRYSTSMARIWACGSACITYPGASSLRFSPAGDCGVGKYFPCHLFSKVVYLRAVNAHANGSRRGCLREGRPRHRCTRGADGPPPGHVPRAGHPLDRNDQSWSPGFEAARSPQPGGVPAWAGREVEAALLAMEYAGNQKLGTYALPQPGPPDQTKSNLIKPKQIMKNEL